MEGDDVEGSVVDRHGRLTGTLAATRRERPDVGEVQSLLSHLGHLTLDGELHVVDARDNLCAGHASSHAGGRRAVRCRAPSVSISGQNLDGESSLTGFEVGGSVGGAGLGVLEGEDGVLGTLLQTTSLDALAQAACPRSSRSICSSSAPLAIALARALSPADSSAK